MITEVVSFRPKRSEVIISLGLLFFAFFAFLITHDLFYDASWPYGWEGRIEYQWWTEFGSFLIVALFGIPTLLWHACDAFVEDQCKSGIDRTLGSYPLVLSLLILGLLGNAVIESGFTEWLYCFRWEPIVSHASGNEFFFLCHAPPAYGIKILVLPFLMALLLIAFARIGALVFRKLA